MALMLFTLHPSPFTLMRVMMRGLMHGLMRGLLCVMGEQVLRSMILTPCPYGPITVDAGAALPAVLPHCGQ